MLGGRLARYCPANHTTQRIIHYQGHRPLRTLLCLLLGFVLGYYAATHDSIDRLVPEHRPAVLLR